ncbi:hypothetical protein EVJ50_06375 [Synechococcus sp. RSCCF101]|uniref:hypothetical protein n=1 Tax=Synechococcus sp. RSCCF101 TaxID=2511069 RepID=UPI0012476F91|nr:hypothetical protein [Synechococcus sp. RSCCF101]QEY31922.1 hypothetical protein EVJ50_06375 [Synechococcus sp. RSCCF101]
MAPPLRLPAPIGLALLLLPAITGPARAQSQALVLQCRFPDAEPPEELILIQADPERSVATLHRLPDGESRPAQAVFTDNRLSVSYLEGGSLSKAASIRIERRSGVAHRSGERSSGRCRSLEKRQ